MDRGDARRSTTVSGVPRFAESMAAYEAGLTAALGDALVVVDLDAKHRKMARSAFLFLRAACWRWAECAADLCPELGTAPKVPSVGDAHAGNFGLWRDAHARLVWGVNDYDEAARLPYPLDLVRLLASLIVSGMGADDAVQPILEGYRAGLDRRRALVLERDHLWLRDAIAASDDARDAFWRELAVAPAAGAPSSFYVGPLLAALPTPRPQVVVSARSAGAGSLGRPRFVAFGEYRSGPVAVEVKALLPSCWTVGREPGLAAQMATGMYRSPDPVQVYGAGYVLRRLAPNSRKVDFAEMPAKGRARLIRAMGSELASVHAEADADREAIADDFDRRRGGWLADAGRRVAARTQQEFATYCEDAGRRLAHLSASAHAGPPGSGGRRGMGRGALLGRAGARGLSFAYEAGRRRAARRWVNAARLWCRADHSGETGGSLAIRYPVRRACDRPSWRD